VTLERRRFEFILTNNTRSATVPAVSHLNGKETRGVKPTVHQRFDVESLDERWNRGAKRWRNEAFR
jgi:hypothetical protein